MKNLSVKQLYFAAALPIEPLLIEQTKKQANDDGAFIERVHWKPLVDCEIAKLTVNSAGELFLCRGRLWSAYNQKYGNEMVKRGLVALKVQNDLANIFGPVFA